VPQAQWQVAMVGNVVSADAQRHPLTWLRRDAADQERLAAALQVALPRYHGMTARVAFGAPMSSTGDAAALHAAVIAQARRLIADLQRGSMKTAGAMPLPMHPVGPPVDR
jgi:hypothetical protein